MSPLPGSPQAAATATSPAPAPNETTEAQGDEGADATPEISDREAVRQDAVEDEDDGAVQLAGMVWAIVASVVVSVFW